MLSFYGKTTVAPRLSTKSVADLWAPVSRDFYYSRAFAFAPTMSTVPFIPAGRDDAHPAYHNDIVIIIMVVFPLVWTTTL